MDERRLRIGSLFEWLAAALGVLILIWVVSVPVQRLTGPRVEAALVDTSNRLPPGVPAGAISVPVMVLLDGRQIRHGDLHTRVMTLLPDKLATAPPLVSPGEFGERQTRAYRADGTTFYVVSERLEPAGPMRVSGVYVP